MDDKKYLLMAIDKAKESYQSGAFPAGAAVVSKDQILSAEISASYPKINYHAESKAIDAAIEKINNQLSDCTLYASMQPCLMCLSRAYWAGIRRIVFCIRKEKVDQKDYEANIDYMELIKKFNENIEVVQIGEFENSALEIVKKWEAGNYK